MSDHLHFVGINRPERERKDITCSNLTQLSVESEESTQAYWSIGHFSGLSYDSWHRHDGLMVASSECLFMSNMEVEYVLKLYLMPILVFTRSGKFNVSSGMPCTILSMASTPIMKEWS